MMGKLIGLEKDSSPLDERSNGMIIGVRGFVFKISIASRRAMCPRPSVLFVGR